jgi:tetratricopeptide (TPR) repeat protein
LRILFLSSILFLLSFNPLFAADNSEANLLESQGIMLTVQGRLDEGLALMKKAVKLEPHNALRHMNYGSILMAKGKNLFDGEPGDRADGIMILREAVEELQTAVKYFKNTPPDRLSRGNCYALLGDIHLFAFEQKDRALAYYQRSLQEDPQNVGVTQIVESLTSAQ